MDHRYSVLILGDGLENAELVAGLLAAPDRGIVLALDPTSRIARVREVNPDVLAFVFEDIRESEECLAELQNVGRPLAALLSRGGLIAFCSKMDLERAYSLCENKTFDDYVLFWPMAQDGSRLRMVVAQALRRVENLKALRGIAAATGPHSPLAAAIVNPHGEGNTSGTSAEQTSEQGNFILFVDDDPIQHTVLQLMLDGTGVSAHFAEDAATAISVLRSSVPRAILVDFNLPGMNGIELICWIRDERALLGIPVVMVTWQSERAVVLRASAAGINDFIAKPFTKETLLNKLTRLGALRRSGES